MGIETALLAIGTGLSIASSVSKVKQAKKQSKAVLEQGKLQAQEREKSAIRLAKSQRASFLSSGISLTGAGDTAGAVIGETQQFGLEDIRLIKRNYETQASNIQSQARSEFIGDLASIAGQAFQGFQSLGGGEKPVTDTETYSKLPTKIR